MSLSKLTGKRPHSSISSSDSEGGEEGSQRQAKRQLSALQPYLLALFEPHIKSLMDARDKAMEEKFMRIISELAKPSERSLSRSIERGDTRNLQLHFLTRLALTLYTGQQIKGEKSTPIRVALIDANTGKVVDSGPEASIKLEVVVLEGDFNKEKNDNWTREDFENYQARERQGKPRLLIGDVQVTLKGGVGELGNLKFTDNSSCGKNKKYIIGLKVATGYCKSIRIREAITGPLRVLEVRGKSYEKHDPANPDDEVWRLKWISRNRVYHTRLSQKGIFVVEDLLREYVRDPKSLRNVLGDSMTDTKWDELIRNAKSCVKSGKLYVYFYDVEMRQAVIFDITGQLKGHIADGSFSSDDFLSYELKEQLNNTVTMAYNDWDHVKEFKYAKYCMPNPVPGISLAGALQGPEDLGTLAPPMVFEGYNDIQNSNLNAAIQNPPVYSINQVEPPVHQNSLPDEPNNNEGQDPTEKLPLPLCLDEHGMEALMFDNEPENWLESLLRDYPSPIPASRCNSRAAVVSWLRIKAVFKWGFFRRKVANKVRPTIELLN